ncbi:MAG: ABC transporter ATP-binding protein [Desulfobacteraceae bacterium]|nr:MAG: ABC transporter ATP-binding protein [Desulfobacteraceae bacterium]
MSNLLEVHHLKKFFPAQKRLFGKTSEWVQAVDDVSFHIPRGRTLGLVGESGCGKSTAGRSVLRLIEADAGQILFEGKDILKLNAAQMRPLRRDMQLIFQDPFASLNPRLTASEIIEESLIVHRIGTREDRRECIAHVLNRVGIRKDMMDRYPHEFSGGQRQRIGIARALVLNPKLIIADEPVSALDVSIQAQVMNLMVEIQEERNLSYLIIAHDLAVVEYLSDRIAVMYLGKIVEAAGDREIYTSPRHPYTRFLLASIPTLDPAVRSSRKLLKGEVPSPLSPPQGCRFHPRCPERMEICGNVAPEFKEVAAGHWSACHLYETVNPAETPTASSAGRMYLTHQPGKREEL